MNYIEKEGKLLRCGYTTGTCAAAAAKAAAWMLLEGTNRETISLTTPNGTDLDLDIHWVEQTEDAVSCAIQKDSGDDPDVTDGALIVATVSRTDDPDILIDGGEGVGRVTKRGLDQPVGQAAINSVPRQMIRESVDDIRRLMCYRGGLSVVISVPQGRELAKKTFNPRLGITGGISILGTTGIVEPMSDQAIVDTIAVELKQRRAHGDEYVLFVPGNYGVDFIRDELDIDPDTAVQTSNFIGDSLDLCRRLRFKGALLIGHIGKLVKIAGGMFNTHSKYGDCRMDILAAQAAACGMSAAGVQTMLACVTCDEAVRLMKEEGVCEQVLEHIVRRINEHINVRTHDELETGVVIFSRVYGLLGKSKNADRLTKRIVEG